MKIYDDITPALRAIQMNYQRGYTRWISIKVKREKLASLEERWAEQYGTRLAPYQRQDKKSKGLPTGVAVALPILQDPGRVEVLLMATEHASTIKVGPFSREVWQTRWPEASKFVLLSEQRDRGDSAVTWRIQARDLGLMESHLFGLVKSSPSEVGQASRQIVALHPMYGGVRRQIRRLLGASKRLWEACHPGRAWPGPDPEGLPMMVGFKNNSPPPGGAD